MWRWRGAGYTFGVQISGWMINQIPGQVLVTCLNAGKCQLLHPSSVSRLGKDVDYVCRSVARQTVFFCVVFFFSLCEKIFVSVVTHRSR